MKMLPMLALAAALVTAVAGPGLAAETLLRLAETAQVMVPPDRIVATLRAEAAAPVPAEAQARVNDAISRALARAKQVAGISTATGGYAVWSQTPRDRPSGREEWRAAQTLNLEGRDGGAMLQLVGVLQADGLAVERLDWQLAPETARTARGEATRLALGRLRARVEEAAGILGLRFDSFREVRLDNVRPAPVVPAPRAMAASAMSAMPSPSAVAEDVPVEASAEADAVLVPR